MTMNASPIVIKFGKHKGKDMANLVKLDPKYCHWLIHQPNFKKNNNELYNFFIENEIEFDEDYDKKKQEIANYKSEYITFGKYKGTKITDVFEQDPNYCKYIITLENVKTYHKQFVKIINDLSMTEQING